MTRPIPPSRRWLVPFLVFLAVGCLGLSGCISSDYQFNKESAVSINSKNLWQIIDDLTRAGPSSKEELEQKLNIELQEELKPSNEFHLFYEAKNLELSEGSIISKIATTRKKTERNLNAIGLDIEGTCITLAAVQSRYANLKITGAPRGQSLDEMTTYSFILTKGILIFGFKERSPNCLAHVALKFR